MKNLAISSQELFEEILERGRLDGINNIEAYKELVENVIEAHRAVGELHEDNNLEGMETILNERWGEFESLIRKN